MNRFAGMKLPTAEEITGTTRVSDIAKMPAASMGNDDFPEDTALGEPADSWTRPATDTVGVLKVAAMGHTTFSKEDPEYRRRREARENLEAFQFRVELMGFLTQAALHRGIPAERVVALANSAISEFEDWTEVVEFPLK